MPSFGLIGPAYQNASPVAAGEESINLYLERVETPGEEKWILLGSPGIRRFATLPTLPVRGLFAGDNRVFAVGGPTLWEITPDGKVGSYTDGDPSKAFQEGIPLGNVGAATTPATIVSNGTQLFIVSGNKGYIADGIQVTPVVDCEAGCYLDGYFFAKAFPVSSDPDSNRKVLMSGLVTEGGGALWDPLDFFLKLGSADSLATIFSDHEELWLFGRKTTEPWRNVGDLNNPFQRVSGAVIEQGCWAPFSIDKLDNTITWLGGDDRGVGMCWKAQGYTPLRISNHAVEFQWSRYPTLTDVVSYVYQEGGHTFKVLHFPSGDATWVYDATASVQAGYPIWHRRGLWDGATGKFHCHPGRFHCYAFGGGTSAGRHLVGDYRSGDIYEQSIDILDDAGSPKRWLRSSPHVQSELKVNRYVDLVMHMQVGGSKTMQETFRQVGGDPQILLRFSDDGGFTWSDFRQSSIGKLGEYLYRVQWRQLGRSRNRVFEISGADPVQVALLDAYLTVQPGTGH